MSTIQLKRRGDHILLDPILFDDFSSIKYGIPFLKLEKDIYLLLSSKSDALFKIANYNVNTFYVDEEDYNEKIFLIKNYKTFEEEKFFSKETPTRVILDYILFKSLMINVSDIHIDCIDSSSYVVKFKKDTILEKFCILTKEQGESLLIRLKVLCGMDIAKKNIPQSSSFYRNFRGKDVDFRLSTHPTFLGERCVLRVLQIKNVLPIEKIGLSEDVYEIARKIIEEPYGFVIFTGPTNSGKTTTIHSILKEIAKTGVSIMTLEDPVEYRIPGIIQTNISENGIDFLEGMKSILRQDPNVIFLGEIRDERTAQIAVQAAMVGHKVLTTLHAYSIKGAISRLFDMGVSLKVIAESLLAIFSQRLVRKLETKEGKEIFNGLALVSDACYFDEELKDILRSGEIPDIENRLKRIALKLVESGITTHEEVKRVIG